MTVSIVNAFLPHTDPEASLAFYRDTLGFEVRQDVGSGAMRWLTVGPPDHPEVAVVLYPPGVGPGITDEERTAIAEMMAKGTYAMLTLGSDDLDKTFDQLVAGGAEVVQEPAEQPYGIRDAAFRDPAGNLLRINDLKK